MVDIQQETGGNWYCFDDSSYKMVIGTNGNVNIGSNTDRKLDVNGTGRFVGVKVDFNNNVHMDLVVITYT